MTRTLPVALLLAAVAPAAEPAGNWPHWRGPHADGSAPGADPPTEWDGPSGKNVKWKAALPGGHASSTPVVWGDRVFVLAAVKTDRQAKPEELPKRDPRFETRTEPPPVFYKFVVLCFDRATGKPLWEKVAAEKVPHEGHQVTHSYCGGSPATDGKLLYVSFGSFGNYCYDLDGNLKWSRDLARLHTRLGWGEAVSPVVHGETVILNWDQEADSALYCLEAKTGDVRWRVPRDEPSTWTTPLVTEHGGRTLVVLNGTNRVRAYDLKDGSPVWSAPGTTVNAIPSAVRFGDAAILMGGYKGSLAEAVPLGASGELTGDKVLWHYGKGTPYVPSPAVVGDRLYFTEGNGNRLTVLDAKTGKAVVAQEPLPGVSGFYASPVFAGGRVYLVDRGGTTVVLRPGDTVDVLATNKLGEKVDASPVAVGRQLFLRGEKHLYCIEGR